MISSSDFEGCITHGPWGGSLGNKWVYMPKGITKNIQIRVRYDGIVYSIEFVTDFNEREGQRSFFGGPSGKPTDIICIDNTNEYLMSISGTIGRSNVTGTELVNSICFMTNMNLYGPYGTTSGSVFSHDVKDEVVVGFHGRASKYLNAIGIYVMPKIKHELCSSMFRMTMSRDAGPWGACGGKPWDDGIFSTIKQVRVHLGALNVIYGVQFEYLKSNGILVCSEIHGGTDETEIQLINLDDNDEFFTGISGFYGPVDGYDGMQAIASITFHTNKRTHGPSGEERGAGYVFFSSTSSLGKIVGFHGRSNGFLSAIGVHMEYL